MNADLLCLVGFGLIVLIPLYLLSRSEKLPDYGPDTEVDWWVPIEHFFGEDDQ